MQSLQVTRLLCATDLLSKSEFAIDRAGLLARCARSIDGINAGECLAIEGLYAWHRLIT